MSPGCSAFSDHSFSSSHKGGNAVLVSLEPDEQNSTSARASYYPELGIIPYAGCMGPLSCTLYIIWSGQPIYTMEI